MANSLGTNPIFLDTFAALPLAIWPASMKMRVDHIVYAGYSDATHRITFQDANGVQVWDTLGTLDLSAKDSGHDIGWINGLKLTARSSGQLMIYLK